MYTSIEEIPNIIQSLRVTFQTGLTKDKNYRKLQLQNLLRFLHEKKQDIYEALHKDLHKHPTECLITEIAPVAAEIDFMINNLDELSQTSTVKPQFKMNAMDKCTVRKEPKGVVLIIGAWNYPVHLLLLPVVGAIAAGNCIILKPSEVASHTAAFIARILPEYLDPRAYAVIEGGIEETTVLLAEPYGHIFYTGSGTVGKIVMAAASKTLSSVTLELGGKSPVIVAPDANIQVAASRIMWGKTFNAGQICVAPDYLLIPKSMVDEFIDCCRKIIYTRFGTDPQTSDSYCRIINERRFDTLKGYLDQVDPKKIVVGGQTDKKDLYVEPTLISPLEPNGTLLMEEEIFGPILPIVPVEDVDEAIRIVNSKSIPLTLYIFTDDSKTREKILDNTQSGGVLVNDLLVHIQELSLPFSGLGPSGQGAYHGAKSFETFTHERSTMIKSSGLEGVMVARYPPYTESKAVLFNLLTMGLPEGVIQKVKSIFGAMGAVQNIFFSKKVPNHDSKL